MNLYFFQIAKCCRINKIAIQTRPSNRYYYNKIDVFVCLLFVQILLLSHHLKLILKKKTKTIIIIINFKCIVYYY